MDMKQPWRSLYVFSFLAVLFVFTLGLSGKRH